MHTELETTTRNNVIAEEPVAASSKFVLGSFLAFFVIIGIIVLGDFIGALLRG